MTYKCRKCRKNVLATQGNPRRYIEKICDICDFQPKRLNPEDIKQFDGILSPDWVVNLVSVCDSPNSDNK